MSFFIDASSLIKSFGESVNIKVWLPPSEPTQIYPGGPTTEIDLSDDKAEIRHEPVLPLNSNSAIGRSLLAGGADIQGMLVWYSVGKYPTGTIVNVPDQSGYYEVTSLSHYEPYSHFHEYVLKGTSQDGITNE